MRKTTDSGGKKAAPVIVTVLVILYILPLVLFALSALRAVGGDGGILPILFLLLYLFIGGAVIGGVLKALFERLREIDGGEEDDASQY